MRTNKLNSESLTGAPLAKLVIDTLGWSVLGMAVGASVAFAYGALFAALYFGLLMGNSERIGTAVGYFALCGALAGALIAGFGRCIGAWENGVGEYAKSLSPRTDSPTNAGAAANSAS